MNRWIGTGRPTRDIELRYTQGDTPMAVASFTLACNRKFAKDGQTDADFIRCTAFGKTAETIAKYCQQGTKILIEGRIVTANYTNKDGVKVYTTEISIESFEFCEKKGNSEGGNAPSSNSFVPVPDDINEELPFN